MTNSAGRPLTRCRVLVVEDEFYIADDMANALRKLGAEVIGPVSTQERALDLVSSGDAVDAAVLDVSLRGRGVFPVADVLAERGVPFVFATGYDQSAIPEGYEAVPRWEKPFDPHDLAKALPQLIART
jgi:CheY-like chemotaxis protein